MLKTILSISGKPGLFKLISQAKNMLIVESLQTGKRQPAYAHEKIISLGDIAIFTDEEDVPLSEVLNAIKEKENGAKVTLDIKKADNETLRAYLAEVLPNFDRERTNPEVLEHADQCIQDVLDGTAKENHSGYPVVVRNQSGTPFLPSQLLDRYLSKLPLKGFPCEEAV